MNTSQEILSAFNNRLIDNCLLYVRPVHTQTLLQMLFSNVSKVIQYGLLSSFCCIFFTILLVAKPLKLYRYLKIKYDSLCTGPIYLASSAVDGRHGNKVSWYPVLSKLIIYLPED